MIPEVAVEAAAKRIYLDSPTGRRTCEAWEGMDDGAQSYYRLDARRILEAAAPHILAEDTSVMNMTDGEFQEAIRAAKLQAWDEGHEEGWLNHESGLTEPQGRKRNPYRPAT